MKITRITSVIRSYVHNKLAVFSPPGAPRRKPASRDVAAGPPLIIKGQGCKRREYSGDEPIIDILC